MLVNLECVRLLNPWTFNWTRSPSIFHCLGCKDFSNWFSHSKLELLKQFPPVISNDETEHPPQSMIDDTETSIIFKWNSYRTINRFRQVKIAKKRYTKYKSQFDHRLTIFD